MSALGRWAEAAPVFQRALLPSLRRLWVELRWRCAAGALACAAFVIFCSFFGGAGLALALPGVFLLSASNLVLASHRPGDSWAARISRAFDAAFPGIVSAGGLWLAQFFARQGLSAPALSEWMGLLFSSLVALTLLCQASALHDKDPSWRPFLDAWRLDRAQRAFLEQGLLILGMSRKPPEQGSRPNRPRL